MRGSKLAERMAEHGVPWNRTTVAKFETGRRATISVQELVALALALDVPLAALLIDPREPTVPLAKDVAPDPWSALLWLAGRSPLGRSDLNWRNKAGLLVTAVRQADEALSTLDALENPVWSGGQPTARDVEMFNDKRASYLSLLSPALALLDEQGLRPPLPDFVLRRAAELGVDLPGVES